MALALAYIILYYHWIFYGRFLDMDVITVSCFSSQSTCEYEYVSPELSYVASSAEEPSGPRFLKIIRSGKAGRQT